MCTLNNIIYNFSIMKFSEMIMFYTVLPAFLYCMVIPEPTSTYVAWYVLGASLFAKKLKKHNL